MYVRTLWKCKDVICKYFCALFPNLIFQIGVARSRWHERTIPTHIPLVPHICHYFDVIMGEVASQITSLAIVYSTVYSDADQRKHQSSASLAFVWGSHRGPVNSPHKWPVTRKMFPFDDVIMGSESGQYWGWGWDLLIICSCFQNI